MSATCPDPVAQSSPRSRVPRGLLVLEFVLLYGSPLLVARLPFRVNPLPLLWLATLYCLWILRADPQFDGACLSSGTAPRKAGRGILVLFCAVALMVTILVYTLARPLLFGLPRARPWLWAVIMFAYPLLSVYPQGIVYRVFLFHRYGRRLRRDWLVVAVSAAAFSLAHVLLHNPLAIASTFAGGLLFAWRYGKTGSLLASAFEHALYGCWMFTVGLGAYFYHAAR